MYEYCIKMLKMYCKSTKLEKECVLNCLAKFAEIDTG